MRGRTSGVSDSVIWLVSGTSGSWPGVDRPVRSVPRPRCRRRGHDAWPTSGEPDGRPRAKRASEFEPISVAGLPGHNRLARKHGPARPPSPADPGHLVLVFPHGPRSVPQYQHMTATATSPGLSAPPQTVVHIRMRRRHTATLPRRNRVAVLQCDVATESPCHNATSLHRHDATEWPCCPETPPRCGTVALSRRNAATMWRRHHVTADPYDPCQHETQ